MANDIWKIRSGEQIKNDLVTLGPTPSQTGVWYLQHGDERWDTVDGYAQKVLAGRFHAGDLTIPLTAADRATALTGDAVVVYPALPGISHEVNGVEWSYNATPTNGGLRIEDGSGNIVRSVHITAAGAGFFDFHPPVRNALPNTQLLVVLQGGGAGVSGSLNVEHQLA